MPSRSIYFGATLAALFSLTTAVQASSTSADSPADGGGAQQTSADARILEPPKNLPPHWRTGFVKEPVFGSKILKIEAGLDNKQTILMIHGLGQEGHRVWIRLMMHLEKDYHIITFDLPGFGRSERPAGKYTPENYGRIVKWLNEEYAKGPAIVMGHSMGGGVALHYSARYPDRVVKVILIDAAGILEKTAFVKGSAKLPIKENVLPGFLNQWVNQLNNLVAQAIEWANVNPDPIEMLRMTDMGWNALLSDQPNTNAALGLITHDFSEEIDGFAHETDLIWGGRDSIAPLRIAHLLNGRLPRSRLHVIADAAHVPMKSHAVQFNALIDQALQPGFEADSPMPPMSAGRAVLECDNRSGVSYSGHYKRIVMNRCLGVTLTDVTAESMELNNTIVEMTNVRIQSAGTAVDATNSGITVTNGDISGAVAFNINASRLDLAGVTLDGKQAALITEGESFLIASVSDVILNHRRCFIHGTYRLTDQTLEASLPDDCTAGGMMTFLRPVNG